MKTVFSPKLAKALPDQVWEAIVTFNKERQEGPFLDRIGIVLRLDKSVQAAKKSEENLPEAESESERFVRPEAEDLADEDEKTQLPRGTEELFTTRSMFIASPGTQQVWPLGIWKA